MKDHSIMMFNITQHSGEAKNICSSRTLEILNNFLVWDNFS